MYVNLGSFFGVELLCFVCLFVCLFVFLLSVSSSVSWQSEFKCAGRRDIGVGVGPDVV